MTKSGITVRQAGWTICAQLEHSIRVSDVSPVSSWLGSLQTSHTADSGSPGCRGPKDNNHTDAFANKGDRRRLTERHCRSTQVCFSFPGPPNFFISLQKLQSPHSGLTQASQRLHLQQEGMSYHPKVQPCWIAPNHTHCAYIFLKKGLKMVRLVKLNNSTFNDSNQITLLIKSLTAYVQ